MATFGPIEAELIRSVRAASLPDTDKAAIRLGRRVARLLDAAAGTEEEVDVFKDLAPRLRDILNDLGLTPAGRRVKGGKTDDNATPGGSALARLIAERGPGTRVN